MNKQLKKLLLVFGFVAVATMSYAVPVTIHCENGDVKHFNTTAETTAGMIAEALQAAEDLC